MSIDLENVDSNVYLLFPAKEKHVPKIKPNDFETETPNS